jgi:hypothetical protein
MREIFYDPKKKFYIAIRVINLKPRAGIKIYYTAIEQADQYTQQRRHYNVHKIYTLGDVHNIFKYIQMSN